MIKPIGNRLLIRIEERKQLIKLMNDDKKSNWRFFIEEIGDEVGELRFIKNQSYDYEMNQELKANRIHNFNIGDEIILFEHTHFQGWPDCEKEKNLRIISVADVWGVVQKDKE